MYSSFNAGGEESGTNGDNNDETQLPFLRGVTLLEGGWVDNVLQVGKWANIWVMQEKHNKQCTQHCSASSMEPCQALKGLYLPSVAVSIINNVGYF